MSTAAQIDYEAVKAAAEGYREDMTRFLRALIKAKGTSCQEGEKAKLIQAGVPGATDVPVTLTVPPTTRSAAAYAVGCASPRASTRIPSS